MIFSLILLLHSVTASMQMGAVMPDGKVDKVVSADNQATGKWHAPVWGVDVNVDFAPDWKALQQQECKSRIKWCNHTADKCYAGRLY